MDKKKGEQTTELKKLSREGGGDWRKWKVEDAKRDKREKRRKETQEKGRRKEKER